MRTAYLMRGLSVLALLFMTAGCVFQRSVVNRGEQDLDVSFIRIGKTEYKEVLEKLGPPDIPLKDLRNFHYTSVDRRQSGFVIRLGLFLPFIWYDERRIHQVLVELDDNGTVIGVCKSVRHVVRPPLESEEDREAVYTEVEDEESS